MKEVKELTLEKYAEVFGLASPSKVLEGREVVVDTVISVQSIDVAKKAWETLSSVLEKKKELENFIGLVNDKRLMDEVWFFVKEPGVVNWANLKVGKLWVKNEKNAVVFPQGGRASIPIVIPVENIFETEKQAFEGLALENLKETGSTKEALEQYVQARIRGATEEK